MKKIRLLLLIPLLLISCQGTNKCKIISYEEYINNVLTMESDDKFIVVFTQKGCFNCKQLRPYLNAYIKNDNTIPIYEVDVSVENGKYKDSSLGTYKGDNDHLKDLDKRIYKYVNQTKVDTMLIMPTGQYNYVSTPLIIWYENKIETKMSNKILSILEDPIYETISQDDFNNYLNDSNYMSWDVPFDLKAN